MRTHRLFSGPETTAAANLKMQGLHCDTTWCDCTLCQTLYDPGKFAGSTASVHYRFHGILPAGDCCLIPPVQLETNKNGMLFDRVLCLVCGSLNEFAIV